MTTYFITGNKNKFEEAQSILQNVKQLDIDLPEIQDVDANKVVKAKLLEALNHKKGNFIVEDTSLYLDCLNNLPGPLIKWFIKRIGSEGLCNITKKLGDNRARAKTIFGYAKNTKDIYFFEGAVKGKIVPPKGKSGFGWDAIFKPEKASKSFAEMDIAEKNAFSMRRIALNKLKKFMG